MLVATAAAAATGAAGCQAANAQTAGAPAGGDANAPAGRSIVVAGQHFDVGRPVVLWTDPEGFDGTLTHCIDQTTGGCCEMESKRYGVRKGVTKRTLEELQGIVQQFVLHFDGCVNSRSCFKSMHNRTRAPGSGGCGLSAHFMIDADGTIYQTMDLVERAFHAEEMNSTSVGVEICNRGKVNRDEWPKLPAEYRTRPTREVTINGYKHEAYDFRPEQYESIVAVTRALLRLFPKMKPEMPETPDGNIIMDTMEDPLAFSGILGHWHVDLQKQKWDPGALDWKRILRALNGFDLPVQVRSFTEVPRTQADLLAARRAVFGNAEERATGFFPIAPARLWHSGVHLRAQPGAPVRAPIRGHIVAVRSLGGTGEGAAASSRSLVLIRHDIEIDGAPFTFYSLLAHLDLPAPGSEEIPWLQEIAHSPEQKAALERGEVVPMNRRVEAGDPVGRVGFVSRGPEQGPEVHFEIFSVDRPGGEFGRTFRYINAGGDGPLVRRADLVTAVDKNGDQQVDTAELSRFFRAGDLDRRAAFRRLAIRHRHEWGDRNTEADLVGMREMAGIPEADRRKIYRVATAPYIFWTDELSQAIGLPMNQTIYSYNPLTFLLEVVRRDAKVDVPTPTGRPMGETTMEPRKLARVPVADWVHPATAMAAERPVFGAPVGMRLAPKKKEDIPLIELAPTDSN